MLGYTDVFLTTFVSPFRNHQYRQRLENVRYVGRVDVIVGISHPISERLLLDGTALSSAAWSQYPVVNSLCTVAQIAIMAKKWKKRSADTTPVDEQQVSFVNLSLGIHNISNVRSYHA